MHANPTRSSSNLLKMQTLNAEKIEAPSGNSSEATATLMPTCSNHAYAIAACVGVLASADLRDSLFTIGSLRAWIPTACVTSAIKGNSDVCNVPI